MHQAVPIAPPQRGALRIVYLGAGAGGMYCGSCLHDNTLVTALRAQDIDALLVPTYTPIRTDETPVSERRIFFGGINVYLQQRLPLFRHTPWFIDRLFDSPRIINWLARRSSTTDARVLGALTVSMLRGEHGHQRKELDKLVRWLADEVQPDVVHLSNALLVGMARQLREVLGVPVVVTLSGEDVFLDKLPEPYQTEAIDEIRRRAADVAALVALNRYYADSATERFALAPDRVHVIPHGLSLDDIPAQRGRAEGPLRIGYFARVCEDKGLHHLVEACGLLVQDPDLPPLRLEVAGYLGAGDREYFAAQQRRVAELGYDERFRYHGELDRAAKLDFLRSLDVMSVPTVYRESKGLSILEAWSVGVPVVLPAHGTFPELIEDTGGGLLCEPGNSRHLAERLRELLLDPQAAQRKGAAAQQAVRERYHAELMAERTLAVYRRVIEAGRTA